ncbi:MAG: HEAT repeat domain-containing protein, partial [Candidatus Hydrogenedentes bacterium]|nr:HEAT repeat domain-containing protein [Candidatus Hydrogenedentota bacterium]
MRAVQFTVRCLAGCVCVALVCGQGVALDAAEIAEAVAATASLEYGGGFEETQRIERLVQDTHSDPALRACLEDALAAQLTGEATTAAKQFACKVLRVVGTERSLPALTTLLRDSDVVLVEAACYAMSGNASPRVDEAIRAAIPGAEGPALVALINLAGDRGDPECCALLAGLTDGADAAVAEAAIAALGKLATGPAVERLAALRGSDDATRRAAAMGASLRAAHVLAAREQTDDARALFAALAGPAVPVHVRRGALLGRIGLGGPEAADLVVATLNGDDEALKPAAIAGVLGVEGSDIDARLVKELPAMPPDGQVLLIAVLAERGRTERGRTERGRTERGRTERGRTERGRAVSMPALIKAAGHADAAVRAAALEGLGRMGDASVVPVLVEALAGGGDEADAAGRALRMLTADGVDEAIIRALQAAQPKTRAELITCVGDREYTAAVPLLLEEAGSTAGEVAKAAFRAVRELGSTEDVPAAVKALIAVKADRARAEGEACVIRLANSGKDRTKAAKVLSDALASAKDVPTKQSLLRTLGGVNVPLAFKAIDEALEDGDSDVLDTVVRVLADWPEAQAMPVLLRILEDSDNDVHRTLAFRGYVRLLSTKDTRPPSSRVAEFQRVMPLVRNADDKRLVLAGLDDIALPEALACAAEYLDDAEVRPEAALAVVTIASSVAPLDPERATSALQKVLAATEDDGVRARAQGILDGMGRCADFIVAWMAAGPYTAEGKNYSELFDTEFPPEKKWPGDLAPPLPVDLAAGKPWLLDLSSIGAGEQRVAYVSTWIESPVEQPVRIEVGSDDGVKVWLNGTVVHANNASRGVDGPTDRADATLRAGWNALMLKVTQGTGGWAFCARIRARDGGALGGLRVDPRHEGAAV